MPETNEGFELTEERIAKMKQCSTPEELVALAREEGIELTDGQLEAISGGTDYKPYWTPQCPRCGSHKTSFYPDSLKTLACACDDCGYQWEFDIPQ